MAGLDPAIHDAVQAAALEAETIRSSKHSPAKPKRTTPTPTC
jgi:hypothetical protein